MRRALAIVIALMALWSPAEAADRVPSPALILYYSYGFGPRNETVATIMATAPQFNMLYLYQCFSLHGDGDVSSIQGIPPHWWEDIKAWKKSGRKVVLGIAASGSDGDSSGGLGNARFRTPADAHAAVTSLTRLIDQYGFQGIDWDLEGPEGSWNDTTINAINAQLRAHYGPSFILSMSPRTTELRMGPGLGSKRAAAAQYDLIVTQWYYADKQPAREILDDFMVPDYNRIISGSDGGPPIPENKLVIGVGAPAPGTDYGYQPAEVAMFWQAMRTQHPRFGGIALWEARFGGYANVAKEVSKR